MSHDQQSAEHEGQLGRILTRLFREAETLFLQEIALLRAETSENARRLLSGFLLLCIGLAVALMGLAGLLVASVLLLALVTPPWAAAAIAGSLAMSLGGVVGIVGWQIMRRSHFVPSQSWRTLQETGEWLKEELT